MATKQFGRLKVHWSKRGIAYKWGDGEIRRLSFEGRSADPQAHRSPEDGYTPYDSYDSYGRGYAHDGGYPPPDDYQAGGYYPGPDEGAPAGRYDVLYTSDWLTWLLLVVLPPLGIWILWKRERLEPRMRLAVSAAAAIWFVVLLVMLFSALFNRGTDQTVDVGNIQRPDTLVIGATASPAPTGIQAADLSDTDTSTEPDETLAPGAAVTPRPNAGDAPADTGEELADDGGGEGDPDTTYIWSVSGGAYYHNTDTCPDISGTPSRISMDIARSRGQTACPTCYGAQSSGTTYFATSRGKYYHTTSNCSGMKNAVSVTRAQAVAKGKKPCPVCIGSYYATPNGKYYHAKSNCSGMSGAVLVTKAKAVAAGKAACPVCLKKAASSSSSTAAKTYYSTSAGKHYHANPTCSGMKGARKVTAATAKKRGQTACPVCIGTKAASSTVYYATTAGKYYHTKSNCSGMKNARKITQATAKSKGKQPCPVCIKASSAAQVYATTAGKYYHKNATCSGMKDARKVTLATAKSAGKTACPVCMKTTATTNYYATVGGKHYHSKSTCSGMKNATRVTLATAQKRNQTPCPVCLQAQAKTSAEAKTYVYATTAGKYYHSKSGCSGMKNARRVTLASAKNNGKTACPVCMKAQASTSVTYVYSTLSGKYYHKRTCSSSDAKNTKKVALATAKKYGKTPCPTCFKNQTIHVYVTPAGLKYHDKVTCEGVRNTMKITLKTALERKYVRCTVCDAPKA